MDRAAGPRPAGCAELHISVWEANAFNEAYSFLEDPDDSIATLVAINITGALMLLRRLIPRLLGSPRPQLILTGSTSGLRQSGQPEVTFGASKLAFTGIADALRESFRDQQLAVTCLQLGYLNTDDGLEVAPEAAARRGEGRQIPLHDVIRIVSALLQLSRASFVRGTGAARHRRRTVLTSGRPLRCCHPTAGTGAMHTLRPGHWLSGLLLLQTALLPGSLALGGPALAQPADPAAGLVLQPAPYRALIGQPPAPGSRLELDDLAILRWNQRTRTPVGIVHSWRFLNRNLSVFDAAVGADLARTSPSLYAGLPAFLARADGLKDEIKDAVARPRPFVSHPDLKPCLPLEGSWSFPSGHATWFATASLLLADLLPERRERLLPVGLQGGYVRAYCAMHYPSDVLAGQRIAEAISQEVIASPQWRRFKQQVAGERLLLLAVPPAGLPLLAD